MTTQEMKCGKNTTPCTNFLIRSWKMLSNSSASAIGTGKNSSRLSSVMINVFATAFQNAGSAKSISKLASPTNGAFRMPRNGT